MHTATETGSGGYRNATRSKPSFVALSDKDDGDEAESETTSASMAGGITVDAGAVSVARPWHQTSAGDDGDDDDDFEAAAAAAAAVPCTSVRTIGSLAAIASFAPISRHSAAAGEDGSVSASSAAAKAR